MEYNVVEDLNKIKENIYILDICKISKQCNLLLNSLKDEKMWPSTYVKHMSKIVEIDTHKAMVNFTHIGKNSKSLTPPFLITFEIFNQNVHICLVE